MNERVGVFGKIADLIWGHDDVHLEKHSYLFCCAVDNVSEVSQLSTETQRETQREREREREVVWISQKEKELVCLVESRVLAEVSSPSFGVHLICMTISIRKRGGGIFQLLSLRAKAILCLLSSRVKAILCLLSSRVKAILCLLSLRVKANLWLIKVGVRLLSFLRKNMHNIISHSYNF
jgi:hypothetical protein